MNATFHILIVFALAVMPQLAVAQTGVGGAPISNAKPLSDAPWLSREQLRAKYSNREGKIARIGGVEVYYEDVGKGPAILLIHGSIGSSKIFDGLAAILSKHYRVIRYDIPPQGLSGPVSDEALAKLKPVDIPEQLLIQLGVSKVTVVGVSSGGTAGVQLAAKRPDLVQRLILSNSPSNQVRTEGLALNPKLQAAIAEYQKLGYKKLGFWNAFLDFYAGVPARYDAQFREQMYDMSRRAPEPNTQGLVAVVEDHDKAVAAMNAVTAPVLLIWGGADPLLPFAAMHSLASYLTHAQVSEIRLSDVGHYPPMEVPTRYARLVMAYIEAAQPDDAKSKR